MSFPDVGPEPVLAKLSFSYSIQNGPKVPVSHRELVAAAGEVREAPLSRPAVVDVDGRAEAAGVVVAADLDVLAVVVAAALVGVRDALPPGA